MNTSKTVAKAVNTCLRPLTKKTVIGGISLAALARSKNLWEGE
jgi:hypothetical protein